MSTRTIINRDVARRIIECEAATFTIRWISEQRQLGRTQSDIAHEIASAQVDVERIVERATDALALQLYANELNASEIEFEACEAAAAQRGAFSPYHQTWLN